MNFTDIFIRRPVLAVVISLLILIFGLRSIVDLPLRQFPKIQKSVITVNTAYPGANADLIQSYITTPIIKSISSVDGIDYISASSRQSVSAVSVHVELKADLQKTFTDIMGKISEVQKILPKESEKPSVVKGTGEEIGLMYIGFNSDQMTPSQITHYISQIVQPKIESLSGIAEAKLLGGSNYAMRIWLDPQLMAAHNVSYGEFNAAMQKNNFLTTAGNIKGYYIATTVNADTDLHNTKQFQNIVLKETEHKLIRVKDIARVELGNINYDSKVYMNGKEAIYLQIDPTPAANPLSTISRVNALLPKLKAQFPPSLDVKVAYDATNYIRSSIHEVIQTIAEATLIVVLVIFLFLGALRSVIIPVVTIPLSLIGVCSLLLALGYSINLLTLLAMVLAIGLVVDDAIVVVENIVRHIEKGKTPFDAAIVGAREILVPVIAMTITLAAVYAPIALQKGLTGALFKEFALTLACTVIISGIVALILSPMMCSKLLSADINEKPMVKFIDRVFKALRGWYKARLQNALQYRPVGFFFAFVILLSCFAFYNFTQKELAPPEDQSALFVSGNAPESANIDFVSKFANRYNKIYESFDETESYFMVNMPNRTFGGLMLKPWNKRNRSQEAIKKELQQKVNQVSGLQSFVFSMPTLPIAGGFAPLEFQLTSTRNYELLHDVLQKFVMEANKSGLFMFVVGDLKFDKPINQLVIDRNRAGQLGIDMSQVGGALSTALGGNYINRFSMESDSFEVIPQLDNTFRLSADKLQQIYLRSRSGKMVSLDTIATLKRFTQPNQLNQIQQLHSASLQGAIMPGHSMGEVIDFLKQKAKVLLPNDVSYDFTGESRQFIKEGSSLTYTIFFALIIIYLVLAAQFESFLAPVIILFSVPLSMFGALVPLFLGAGSINIYSQIGLITLIGLISKHGILMVDFANQLRETKGLAVVDAIIEAASIRLRPILMTTAAMVLGVLPLLMANGPGANSRVAIGIVIASGMTIGTLFTLFIVPTVYCSVYTRTESKEQAQHNHIEDKAVGDIFPN